MFQRADLELIEVRVTQFCLPYEKAVCAQMTLSYLVKYWGAEDRELGLCTFVYEKEPDSSHCTWVWNYTGHLTWCDQIQNPNSKGSYREQFLYLLNNWMVERENGLTKNGRKVCLLTAAYQPNLPEGMADEDLCVCVWGGVKGLDLT